MGTERLTLMSLASFSGLFVSIWPHFFQFPGNTIVFKIIFFSFCIFRSNFSSQPRYEFFILICISFEKYLLISGAWVWYQMRKKFRWWCSYTVHICKQKVLFIFQEVFVFICRQKVFYLSGSFWLNWCEQRRKHRVWRILAGEYILINLFSEKNRL